MELYKGDGMLKKVFFMFAISLYSMFSMNAIYRSPEGGRIYYWMMSPDLLSLSMGMAGTEKPSGFVINPASSAFAQNIKIELSYTMAPGLWSQNKVILQSAADFFLPLGINGGFVIPSRYGNFAGYLSYMNMSNNGFGYTNTRDVDIGKTGAIYFGYAKDYNDNFSFGFSGNVKFSYNPLTSGQQFDVGGGVDFGLIFRPELVIPFSKTNTSWGLQDFQVALLVKDIGKPLTNYAQSQDSLAWMPAPFTPAVGLSFNLFNNGSTNWKILTDLSGPFFQNLVFAVGTEIQIMKFLVLRGSYTVDLEGILEYSKTIPQYGDLYNIYNFAGGLSLKFSSDTFKKISKAELNEKKHLTTEFSVDLGIRPYHNGLIFELGGVVQLGVRDKNPPVIQYSVNNIYASPNFDGIQDSIEVAIDIKDERYIRSWYLEIYDENGVVVRRIESKEDRAETLNFVSVVKRYFSPKTGIPIPSKVIWDCRDTMGNVVADGTYSFKFFAMDDNKNINLNGSDQGSVVINTKKPEMKSVITNTIFSPGSGGTKDTLIIDLDIIRGEAINVIQNEEINFNPDNSQYEIIEPETINQEVKAQKWTVEIKNVAGVTVKTFSFDDKGKKKIEWDGRDDVGNKVADGVYKIVLHSRDLAGNSFYDEISNIIIDTEPKPITISLDKNIFSPNGDGIKDSVQFSFNIPVKEGIEKWELDIVDLAGKIFRTFSGQKVPPEQIEWDGKNETGLLGKETSYTGRLNVHYINGTKSTGETQSLAIDITAPKGIVTNFTKAFSPNGDSVKDIAVIDQTTSLEDEWLGFIYDKDGKIVKNYIWKSQAPVKFTWDGKSDSGALLSDGLYSYMITSVDRAGNSFKSDKHEIKIDTEDVPLFVTNSHTYFSPNGDGVKDTQVFDLRIKEDSNKDVSEWTLSILNDREDTVFTQKGKGAMPNVVNWNGKNDSNKIALDGNYYTKLNVSFNSGIVSSAKTGFYTLDTIAPDLKIKAVKSVFSPNGDGSLDQFEVLQTGSKEESWEAYVYDSSKNIIWKSFYTDSEPKNKEFWDGKDINGNPMKNGVYSYSIKGSDKAGNSTVLSIENIELKVIHTPVYLTVGSTQFSPNKDGKFDLIEMVPYVTVQTDIDAFTIDIIDSKGVVVKKIQGKEIVPENTQWDGLANDGKAAIDGVYFARLTVLYRFGNMPVVESQKFLLDTTAPGIVSSYKPEFFSPDNDGVDDELSISIESEDLTGIENWKMTVINPLNKKEFISFSGKGKPAELIRWNGIGANGELVESAEDYPVQFYAIDNVGNVFEKELSPINVDILVIRLPDGRLRIKISNIEFLPDLASMTDSPKNVKILNMLSRALKKYNSYNVTIEGHASKFRQDLDENIAKKLSEERSKAISLKLKALGINMNRMTTIGRGFDQPLVPLTPNVDKDELAKNRRVEFYLDK